MLNPLLAFNAHSTSPTAPSHRTDVDDGDGTWSWERLSGDPEVDETGGMGWVERHYPGRIRVPFEPMARPGEHRTIAASRARQGGIAGALQMRQGGRRVWKPPGGFTQTIAPARLASGTTPTNDHRPMEWAQGPTDGENLSGGAQVPLSLYQTSLIESTRAGFYGHPGFTGVLGTTSGCVVQSGLPKVDSDYRNPRGSWLMFDHCREDHILTDGRLKGRFDVSDGQSGSPIYQCIGDPYDCGGVTERIIGIWSACITVPTDSRRAVGPNSHQMFSFVFSNTPGD